MSLHAYGAMLTGFCSAQPSCAPAATDAPCRCAGLVQGRPVRTAVRTPEAPGPVRLAAAADRSRFGWRSDGLDGGRGDTDAVDLHLYGDLQRGTAPSEAHLSVGSR